MLKLELLPAGPGDCIWLEYGQPGDMHIILIDGGVNATYERLAKRIALAAAERGAAGLHLDLVVVTHIDNDHIEGILRLFKEPLPSVTVGDVWFNGNLQLANLPEPLPEEVRPDLLGAGLGLPRPDLLGLKECDQLSQVLIDRGEKWNAAFASTPVMRPQQGELLAWECAGLKLTVLGPPIARLRKLASEWKKFKDQDPEDQRPDLLGKKDAWPPKWLSLPSSDTTIRNGTSIVLLAEYGDQRLLLAGDAFAGDILEGLQQFQAARGLSGQALPLNIFKLPHHGSARNISPELLESVACQHFLISTDGSGNSKHPDQQALLRVLKHSAHRPCLGFNVATAANRNWRDRKSDVLKLYLANYDTLYAEDPEEGLKILFE